MGRALLCTEARSFPERAAWVKNRKAISLHDVANPGDEFTAKRTTGMKSGEILTTKSLALEYRDSERIAKSEGSRRARGGREIVRAGLFLHPGIKHSIALATKCGIRGTRERDRARAKATKVLEQREQFGRLAAL